jgi:hypothetical protein
MWADVSESSRATQGIIDIALQIPSGVPEDVGNLDVAVGEGVFVEEVEQAPNSGQHVPPHISAESKANFKKQLLTAVSALSHITSQPAALDLAPVQQAAADLVAADSAALFKGVMEAAATMDNDAQWLIDYLPKYVQHSKDTMNQPPADAASHCVASAMPTVFAQQIGIPNREGFSKELSDQLAQHVSWAEWEGHKSSAMTSPTGTPIAPEERKAAYEYTGELYKPLNSELRKMGASAMSTIFEHTKAYLSCAVRSIRLCPRPEVSGVKLYRGQDKLHDNLPYEPGDCVTWHAFTSASLNRSVAEMFSGGSVMFVISGVAESCGASVSPLSQYPNEDEVSPLPLLHDTTMITIAISAHPCHLVYPMLY